MQRVFTKILVPVNFNRNTRLALNKSIQLANRFECDIHLLHTQLPLFSIPFFDGVFIPVSDHQSKNEKCRSQLKMLEDKCRQRLNDGLVVTSSIVPGYWQSALKDTIITEHIDLLVMPVNKLRFGTPLVKHIDLNRLSQQTQCPVLTVTKEFNLAHLQNIVVPVSDFLPVKKLTVATYLCRELKGSIHLLGSNGKPSPGRQKKKFLLQAYRLLREYSQVRIHCSLPSNQNDSSGILDYAKDIKADLIVVNTGRESILKGWWNKLRGNYLYREAGIPVLTIASQEEITQLPIN